MSNNKKQKANWHLLLVGVVLGSVITVGAFWISSSDFNRAKKSVVNTGKNLNRDWTGFDGKTLWHFLELAGALAVPILIAVIGHQLEQRDKERADEQKRRDKKRADEQAELERGIAKDNSSEEAIQAYIDNMAKLLLDKELRKELFPNINDKLNPSGYDNPVRDVARTQTITILRRLEGDQERQIRIIHFLRDTELYEFIFENANLSTINLKGSQLSKANLQEATLYKANLQKANLYEANLQEANLYEANLQGAKLHEASLQEVDLSKANLQEANLSKANLQEADLSEANLQEADLSEANLQETVLVGVEKLTFKQIKLACYWEKAIYKGEWNRDKKIWIAIEPDNTKFIEELKKDKSSDPEKPIYCKVGGRKKS